MASPKYVSRGHSKSHRIELEPMRSRANPYYITTHKKTSVSLLPLLAFQKHHNRLVAWRVICRSRVEDHLRLEGKIGRCANQQSSCYAKCIDLLSHEVRYFVLKNGVLSYFTDKKEAQANAAPKGSFHVLSITSIKTMPHKDKKFHNQVIGAYFISIS